MQSDYVVVTMAYGGSTGVEGASTQKLAPLTWNVESFEVECHGRSYWSYLQRERAIDNKQLGNVSAFRVNDGPEEEVRLKVTSNPGHSRSCDGPNTKKSSCIVYTPTSLLSLEVLALSRTPNILAEPLKAFGCSNSSWCSRPKGQPQ